MGLLEQGEERAGETRGGDASLVDWMPLNFSINTALHYKVIRSIQASSSVLS